MKRSGLALAFLLASSGCQGSSGATIASSADEISYSNTGSGLTSTDVQGAVDDVAAIGIDHETRLTAVEAVPARNVVRLTEAIAHGTGNLAIPHFLSGSSVGLAVAYADTEIDGASLTINSSGIYALSYSECSATVPVGFSLNGAGAELDLAIDMIPEAKVLAAAIGSVATTVVLSPGDVVRPHSNTMAGCGAATAKARVSVVRISR